MTTSPVKPTEHSLATVYIHNVQVRERREGGREGGSREREREEERCRGVLVE